MTQIYFRKLYVTLSLQLQAKKYVDDTEVAINKRGIYLLYGPKVKLLTDKPTI